MPKKSPHPPIFFILFVVAFAFAASGFEVGLFKRFTAVWEEKGHRPEVLAGIGWGSGGASAQDLDSLAALAEQTFP